MSINWHTTSQGPKKKSIQITKRRIDPCPAHTARNKGSFTTMVLWTAQRFLSSTVLILSIFPAGTTTNASADAGAANAEGNPQQEVTASA